MLLELDHDGMQRIDCGFVRRVLLQPITSQRTHPKLNRHGVARQLCEQLLERFQIVDRTVFEGILIEHPSVQRCG